MDYWAIDQKLHQQMDRKWYSNKPPPNYIFYLLVFGFLGGFVGLFFCGGGGGGGSFK